MYKYRFGDDSHFDKNGGYGGSLSDKDIDNKDIYICKLIPYKKEGMCPESICDLERELLDDGIKIEDYYAGLWIESEDRCAVVLVLYKKVGEFDLTYSKGDGYVEFIQIEYGFHTPQDRDDYLRSFMI